MYEERFFFERPSPVNLEAAAIGISCWTWDSIDVSNRNWIDEGTQTIKQKRYDVLPIVKEGKVNSYLFINDDGEAEEKNITDSLHFRTPALGSLSALVEKTTEHIFLHNDNHEIVGLLSASNFNCREFATVVFSIITSYESGIANMIRKNRIDVPETDEFLKAKENNLDVDPVESLSFANLVNVMTDNYTSLSQEFGELACSRTKFKSMLSRHVDLRNDVVHSGAGRVLIGDKRTLNELHRQIIEIRNLATSIKN